METAEEQLDRRLGQAQTGSPEALGLILETCRAYLLMIAEKELDQGLRPKGGASDLVQQTFLEAHRDFGHFEGLSGGELRAWLRRLLLNNVANFRRDFRQTAKRQISREVPLHPPDSTGRLGPQPETGLPTPSREMMAEEEAGALHAALAKLPADYREVLLCRYREELPFEEIAQRLGRTSNAVRKLWSRAIEKLQEVMETPP